MGGTSRVTGDGQARICEGLGVKFPGATRRDQRWSSLPHDNYPENGVMGDMKPLQRAIIFDARSARRACALTVQASAQPRRACLPPLVAGSPRGLWPLP